MKKMLIVLFLLTLSPCTFAAMPTDQLKQTIDKVVSVLSENKAREETHWQETQNRIKKILEKRFSYEDTGRLTLGRSWKRLTKEQQKEFVQLFRSLLEETYISKLTNYSAEKIEYVKEEIRKNGKKATVETRIITLSREVSIHYYLRDKNGSWVVYDINVQGVRLVLNYRNQFEIIMAKHDYEGLIHRLRAQISAIEKQGNKGK